MGNTPFKMKGFSGFGGSPIKDGKTWDKIKKTASKVYDKASQIGMGLKQGLYADSDYRGGGTNIIDSFKQGYNKEKTADEAMRKREEAANKTK